MAVAAIRPLVKAVAVAALVTLVAACSSGDKDKDKSAAKDKPQKAEKSDQPPPCPRVQILADAAKQVRFRTGTGRDLTDIVYQAELSSYNGSCSYDWDKQIMKVVLQPGIDIQRGPAATGKTVDISYFIAMPFYFPQPAAKKVVPLTVAFPDGSSSVRYVDEELTLTFPVKDLQTLIDYDIILGLQIDDEQLRYNRAMSGKK